MYKCRNIVDGDVVWFGSRGRDENGRAVPAENYAVDANAVRAAVIEKLSVLQKELWYDKDFGMPLVTKVKTKALIDAHVAAVISGNPGVLKIDTFVSSIRGREYRCEATVVTEYGTVELQI